MSWSTSWERQLSSAFMSSIFHPNTSLFSSLPLEILRRIAVIGLPGNPSNAVATIQDLITFENLALLSHRARDILIWDTHFSESFYRDKLTTCFGFGRPLALRGRRWRTLGRDFMHTTKWLLTDPDGMSPQMLQDNRAGRPEPEQFERKWFEETCRKELFGKKYLGRLPDSWEPPIFAGVIKDTDAQGKLISSHKPVPQTSESDILPLSTLPHIPTPNTPYPVPRDISIGMTFLSVPAMEKMSVIVFMGNLDLGEVTLWNEEGLTWRDLDVGLSGFLQFFLPHMLPSLLSSTASIHSLIHKLSHPFPSRFPGIASGRTSLHYMPRRKSGGEVVMRSLEAGNMGELFRQKQAGE